MEKLLEHLGYGTPFIYAAAVYGLFYWLDENLSVAAKAALAGRMKFKDADNKQVAAAIVEVFDRIYTRTLLSWRAFLRSFLFTFLVTVAYVYEYTDIDFEHAFLMLMVPFINLCHVVRVGE